MHASWAHHAATPYATCAAHTPSLRCHLPRHTAPCMPHHPGMSQHSTPSASTLPVLHPAARPSATPNTAINASHTPPFRRHCAALAALPLRHHYAAPPAKPTAITPQIPHIAPLWHPPTGHAQNGPHAPPKPPNWPLYFWGALLLQENWEKFWDLRENKRCRVWCPVRLCLPHCATVGPHEGPHTVPSVG